MAITLLAILAFEPAMTGGLVWDDAMVIGPASGLPGPLSAFTIDLFAGGNGGLATYYRPLVTLSYWVDTQVFTSAPHVGLHVANLLWHVVASVLVLRTVRRWTVPSTWFADAGCFAAAAIWAVTAHKAENVAWISGRGDVMGLVFALAGMDIAARVQRPQARAAVGVAATVLALLCKESLVSAVPLALADALSRAGQVDPSVTSRLRTHVLAAVRAPYVLAAAATVAVYLVARALVLPISSGGDALMTPVARLDKLVLFLETTGVAATTIVAPWHGELLRSPIGFRDPRHLVHLPAMAALGAATWAALAAAFVRLPAARPSIAAGAGAFLPVSNLIPMAIEARVSDRFLYTPSLGLATGFALVVAHLAPRHARWVALAAIAAAAPLLLASRARAALFASNDELFQWEARHGDRAITVINNAAVAATAADRYRDARDLRMQEMLRYHELGFSGEGFPQLYEAIRSQTLATEGWHPASLEAFETLNRALLRAEAATVLVTFDDGRTVTIDAGHDAAKAFVAARGRLVAANLAFLLARRGETEEALELTQAAVDGCVDCQGVLVTAIQTSLAMARPDLAATWLASLRWWGARRDELVALADAQRAVLDAGGPLAPGLAWFLGGAWGQACQSLSSAAPTGKNGRLAVDVACDLARKGPPGPDARDAERLRWNGFQRVSIARDAAIGG